MVHRGQIVPLSWLAYLFLIPTGWGDTEDCGVMGIVEKDNAASSLQKLKLQLSLPAGPSSLAHWGVGGEHGNETVGSLTNHVELTEREDIL